MDVFTKIIMGVLSLDTIRAILAMTGWVKPDKKFSWLIYGRYERNLIVTALKELGFQQQKSLEISKNLQAVSVYERKSNGITRENAAKQLIVLIAKYIVYFDRPIQYGGTRTTTSSYYIDTMEMSHDEKDKQKLTSIMACLYASIGNQKKPQIIITPKGGNPLFAQSVAKHYGADFIAAKASDDKSRITSIANDCEIDFFINYEGSWKVKNSSAPKHSIIVDCNVSGGTQLVNIVNDLNNKQTTISPPTEAYVLFRADGGANHNIDQKFKDINCTLHRFFDLDEDLKSEIYQLKQSTGNSRSPDIYYAEDNAKVCEIIQNMKKKRVFFYKPKAN